MLQNSYLDIYRITFVFVLRLQSGSGGNTPFRFENMWLEFEGFSHLIQNWWEEAHFVGFAGYIIAGKLVCQREAYDMESRCFL